ncbi:hypothetical protein INR99_06595 [Chitinilyticum litopenaei]|uniref:Uncharacterized protein n=1 Tax=Chitinilyticum piscinae TaxID=2866724 RepID=A0A8J7FH05_9NEIS|nr:hypothetical protein [Chitinilyticum piscinae]
MRLPPLICLIALLWPALAQANAGTPLMWLGAFHLLLGNFFIALFELWLLQRFVRRDRLHDKRNFGLLLLANYLSAWAGFGVLQLLDLGRWVDLHNALYVAWLALPLAWLFTVLLEWPFVWLALRDLRRSGRQALRASFLIQTISYLPLLLLYLFVAPVQLSMLSQTELSSAGSMRVPAGLQVYFLSADRTEVLVWESRGIQKVATVESHDCKGLELGVEDHTPQPRLVLLDRYPLCMKQLNIPLAGPWASVTGWPRDRLRIQAGKAARFPAVASSSVSFQGGFWPGDGLLVTAGGRSWRLATESPVLAWRVTYVQHLPGNLALFQLGSDQIVLYDPLRNQLALLGRGRSPLAVLPSPASH